MFSWRSLTCAAISASRSTASSANSRVTPSVLSSSTYWRVSAALGSVRMRTKSSLLSAPSSTRIGKRPCISGIRSLGLARWNAPEAMNRMWSVLIEPYLVLTVEPSTSGSRSRCTPSRLTSAPMPSLRLATLSISSMNTMPCCSQASIAASRTSSSLTSLPASSSISCGRAALIESLRRCVLPPPMLANICRSCWPISSMPGGVMMSTPTLADSSSSISRSSSSPARSRRRSFCRVSDSCADGSAPMSTVVWPAKPKPGCGTSRRGSSASRIRSSARSSAWVRTFFLACSRCSLTAVSARSRMICSTSLPT